MARPHPHPPDPTLRSSGFQSIPLMVLGYAVTGVDLSRDLLDELERFKGERNAKLGGGADWLDTYTPDGWMGRSGDK